MAVDTHISTPPAAFPAPRPPTVFKARNFGAALLTAWFACEVILTLFLTPADRRTIVTSGRYTVTWTRSDRGIFAILVGVIMLWTSTWHGPEADKRDPSIAWAKPESLK